MRMFHCRSSSSPRMQFLTSEDTHPGASPGVEWRCWEPCQPKHLGLQARFGAGLASWRMLGKFNRAVVSPGGRTAFIHLQCGSGEG